VPAVKLIGLIMNTVITHFYNEEYLLPWWINHHKKIFDHGIMINYHSTDRSVEICKELCPPNWKIVNTVNDTIVPTLNDAEVKVYENNLDGFKMVLTIGEFLLTPCPLNDINSFMLQNKLDYIKTWGVCMVDTDTENLPTHDKSLLEQKHHGMITGYSSPLSMTIDPTHGWFPDSFKHLFSRYYHNQPFGKYTDGRHGLYNVADNKIFNANNIFTLKYKYCPWNKTIIDRMRSFEVKKNEADDRSRIFPKEEHNDIYRHFLSTAYDLNTDPIFKSCYEYFLKL
jgi:hypothetical protein